MTVLTGFLGAGKTTLLNAWLRDPAFSATAVLVNEFGAVGIDDALIERIDGDMLSLVTGCVCCAARGDLVDALARVLSRHDPAAPALARIVIETTGLADPGPVLNALLLAPDLAGAVRPERVVTVVSAAEGDAVLDRHSEARRQVALADHILLSRTDIPEGQARATALRRRLAHLSPAIPIGETQTATFETLRPGSASDADGLGERNASLSHFPAADAGIRSIVLEGGLIHRAGLETFLTLLFERFGGALLRLKGLVAVEGDADRPVVLQAVGGLLHPATRLARWPDGVARTRLVVILEDRDPNDVARLWADIVDPPAIDRPDAAALAGTRSRGRGLF